MPREKILIIDDDPDIVETIKLTLESENYKVISASEGKDGLAKALSEKPALIILDVMMTHLDEGFDIARTLRKETRTKDIPILMLTALQQKTGLDMKSAAGDEDWLPVDDYVDKPIDPNALISKVKKLIS